MNVDENISSPRFRGAELEIDFFGFTQEYDAPLDFIPPAYMNFYDSMQEIINRPLIGIGEDGKIDPRYKTYDPANPRWGKTPDLWNAVNKYLPRYPRRISGITTGPLRLFISVGRTSLDFYHGVDAFFLWREGYATLDVSLVPKHRKGEGKQHLKANFLLTKEHLSPEGMSDLGRDIACVLKNSSKFFRELKTKRRKVVPDKREYLLVLKETD